MFVPTLKSFCVGFADAGRNKNGAVSQRRSWCHQWIMSNSTGAGGSDPLGHCDLDAIR